MLEHQFGGHVADAPGTVVSMTSFDGDATGFRADRHTQSVETVGRGVGSESDDLQRDIDAEVVRVVGTGPAVGQRDGVGGFEQPSWPSPRTVRLSSPYESLNCIPTSNADCIGCSSHRATLLMLDRRFRPSHLATVHFCEQDITANRPVNARRNGRPIW